MSRPLWFRSIGKKPDTLSALARLPCTTLPLRASAWAMRVSNGVRACRTSRQRRLTDRREKSASATAISTGRSRIACTRASSRASTKTNSANGTLKAAEPVGQSDSTSTTCHDAPGMQNRGTGTIPCTRGSFVSCFSRPRQHWSSRRRRKTLAGRSSGQPSLTSICSRRSSRADNCSSRQETRHAARPRRSILR